METTHLTLPIGRVSKETLEPWLQWLGKQDCDFVSFPEVVALFKQIAPRSGAGTNYQDGDLVEPTAFLEEAILFYANMTIYTLVDVSAHILVKFLCNGTVEICPVYLDDSESNELLEENIKAIDLVLEEKQAERKMSWKEFSWAYSEIMEGIYSKELIIPVF